jgi:hypothetical protein
VFTCSGRAATVQVKKGDPYEFFVSGGGNTIGDYTLALATCTSGATATFTTGSGAVLTFDFSTVPPSLQIEALAVSPVMEPPPTTGPTNTRLAAFILPSSNTTHPPATVTVPGGQATSASTVPSGESISVSTVAGGQSTSVSTVPSGQSTGASNSLISTLLVVAARDNSVQSRGDPVAAGRGPSGVASTLLTLLLTGLVAPAPGDNNSSASSGGNDPNADLLIRGTVFDDLDGDGRQAANERGVAGETILLEVQKGGQYVVVNTATTDARGAYGFTDVKPGDYRVRLVTQAGSDSDHTTPTSHTVKVPSDSKPRTINFRKPSKRGTTRNDRGQPYCWVVDNGVPPQENALFEEVDRVFRDWDEVGAAVPFRADVERDGSASDCWLGLLAPIAIPGIASIQWDIPAVERRPGTSRRQET